MRKIYYLFIICLTAMNTISVYGQDNSKETLSKWWTVDACYILGTSHNQLTPQAVAVDGIVNIAKNFQVFGRFEREYTRYKMSDDTKLWMDGYNLGGGLSILTKADAEGRGALRLAVLNSIGSADWKHTVYQASLAFYGMKEGNTDAPFVEIGYRYNKSHSAGISDCSSMFVAFGYCF